MHGPGNLPTERVTKRDLFHVFHKYGKLAQISIKQAYGFIQFLDAAACYQALQAEQGGVVRGRKIRMCPGLEHRDGYRRNWMD
jgi:RNA recognition motif-containing protein